MDGWRDGSLVLLTGLSNCTAGHGNGKGKGKGKGRGGQRGRGAVREKP